MPREPRLLRQAAHDTERVNGGRDQACNSEQGKENSRASALQSNAPVLDRKLRRLILQQKVLGTESFGGESFGG
jgi:hypothetical protein